ncbi:P-loop containing nucleoside triphosphate hydrolase protein [Truncatella angustata]|uniref:P-loop containing nucleoside triphosphate hydrolase protein n=1 Tax=Truncatella angustata TaxID=152316 RepID=A0A9P8USN6_9PEZI|nr:P-loop containing nucleoside triphosphate hydrolase protein [Truncatella angustata]KAH6657397.1 P-loop containing nucleoside triphosphate hydrolase protein [Truncatella angustata]
MAVFPVLSFTPSTCSDNSSKAIDMTADSSANTLFTEKVPLQSEPGSAEANGTTTNETPEDQPNGEQAEPSASSPSGEEGEVKDTKPEDQTMKPEIKHLDKKFDEDGNKVYTERKSRDDKDDKRDWWDLFALCEIRHFWEDGDFKCTQLHVNSPLLKQLLEDVVGDFPNEPIDASSEVEIDFPAYCLFFHREDIEREGTKRFAEDEEGQAHLKILLEHIDNTLEDEFKSYRRAMNSDAKAINYEHLWTIFKPESIVFLSLLGQPRCYKLLSFYYTEGEEPALCLSVEYVDYDGDMFGTRTTLFRIPKYSGTLRIEQLNVKPLELLANKDKISEYLIERGHRFEKLVGQNFLQYSGVAVKRKDCGYERFNLTGRVMIDCKTYHRLDPNDAFSVCEIARSEAAKRQREIRKHNDGSGLDDTGESRVEDELLDEDRLLTNATVRGFAFTHKRFLEFFVDKLSQIEWNTKCFDQLVLDPAPKRTVQALVSMHAQRNGNEDGAFDDIVKGKGQGLVMVLHGPPGVGKTLTAECVAEWVRCPLYMVSSGDLGTDSTSLDSQLTRIMDMTSTWRAVLLIDEADVFLERRSLHDMQRNAMVSVFLRVLEYYSGILFLTTNRVATFDDAFKSRIHVPLRYTSLTKESRRIIWQNFCSRVPGGADIDEEGLERLSEHDLNGRQIKNVVKTAESLAAFEGTKLDVERLEEVTLIQAKFEKDLLEATKAGAEGV